jgi:hypothetical protein
MYHMAAALPAAPIVIGRHCRRLPRDQERQVLGKLGECDQLNEFAMYEGTNGSIAP